MSLRLCKEENVHVGYITLEKLLVMLDYHGMNMKMVQMQKQPPEVFYKKSVPKSVLKFVGKHLCQNFFLNTIASLSLQLC